MRVRIHRTNMDLVGARTVSIRCYEGDSVNQVIQRLVDKLPELRPRLFSENNTLRRSVEIRVNNRSIRSLEGLQTTLNDDDLLSVYPAIN
jgi:molybdopterin converting factor small subunit